MISEARLADPTVERERRVIVEQEACLETLHQWGERVIPYFRGV
ncbi:hypothetical protein ACIF8W_13375 [Streptomyces sp. NPDC085639]